MAPELYDDLAGQVALVTGANRGIGREIAAGLVDLTATVYGGVRDTDNDVPEGVTPVECDVTDEATIESAIADIVAVNDRLDIVVNNAGVGGTGDGVVDLEADAFDHVLDVNLRGPTLVAKHALPHLLDRPGGRIVNVSSGVGILTDPIESAMPAYRMSKAGINALTVELDRTYGDQGLIANSVDPGWVATDLGGEEAPREPEKGAETPVWLSRFRPGSPSGRFWKDCEQIDF
ncbi:SDR family NAD(P)-dependent oxidoreductase [Halococcoides cellulosivorans]|uniref:Short-chain dehydrogenase n=1 Tax=Halococcoides cellulosivorans TaxID=1679096 RepID=A0A2R4X1A5_9EURY|nr:SDR family NAD(P)-dependent oxidoreductase [Halococcoides cellulosivorans]AWB27571.1 short-chain dehydrogenase [Halococcoides cellulosivorans]